MEASHIATRILLVTLVVLAAALCGIAKGNDDDSLCGMSQDELFQCKPAVAAGAATPPPPTAACCAAVTHANLTCFCTFKNSKYLPLFGIDSARAMQLPSKCDPSRSAHC